MPIDLPPQPPPALTAEQKVDLGCLTVGASLLANSKNPSGETYAHKLVRTHLARLATSDGSIDWMSLAKATPEMTYGEFMTQMNACAAPPKAP